MLNDVRHFILFFLMIPSYPTPLHTLFTHPSPSPPSLYPIPLSPLLPSAPEKRGRIQKEDLSAFISRTCRSFGVLLTLLERDLLKGVIQAYRKLRYITSSSIHSLLSRLFNVYSMEPLVSYCIELSYFLT